MWNRALRQILKDPQIATQFAAFGLRPSAMGSGGLGGYFGARLCRGGADVHFIARGAHLQAMRNDGLRVEGPDPMHIPEVNATDDPAEVGIVDFVMAIRSAMPAVARR